MTLTVAVAYTTHPESTKITLCLPGGRPIHANLADLASVDADVIWTDRSIDELWDSGVGAYPHVKTNYWLPTPLHALLQELSATKNPPDTLVSILQRSIHLIVAAFGVEILEAPVLSESIAKVVYEKLYPTVVSGIAQSSYNIATVLANTDSESTLVVRPNRAAHSKAVLSMPCNAELWEPYSSPTLAIAINTTSISQIEASNDAGDTDVRAFYAIGAGALKRQTMLTQPEVCMAVLRHRVAIQKLWVAQSPSCHPLSSYLYDAGCFTYCSLTIGILHEILMVASTTMLPSIYYAAGPSILAAADRAYLLPTVVKLHSLGVKIISYGQGKITIDPLAVSTKKLRHFCASNQLTISTRAPLQRTRTCSEFAPEPQL